jgi:hypothetical protein
MGISFSTFSTTCHYDFVARFDEIFQDHSGFFIDQDGSRRDFKNSVFATPSMATGTLTVFTLFATPELAMSEVDEGVHSLASAQDETASIATIATAWSTLWHVFLTQECDATIAPLTSMELDFDSINEHRPASKQKKRATYTR